MAKRTHEDEDDHYQDGDEGSVTQESPVSSSESLPDIIDPKVQELAYKMVRAVLGLEFKKQLINKTSLQKLVWENVSMRQIRFDTVFSHCQAILDEVFGFKLELLPFKDKKKSTQKAYILISNLESTQKDILGEYWVKASVANFTGTSDTNLPFNKNILGNNAFVLIIISCIALSSNNMNKVELLKYLKTHFDLSPSSQLPASTGGSENVTLEEFLKYMEKTDYIHKSVEKTNDLELIDYSLGRRAKVEFPKDSLSQFIQEMFGIQNDETLERRIALSVGNTYA